MLMLINILLGTLIVLSLAICFVFKSTIVCLFSFFVLASAFIAIRADVQNKINYHIDVINLLWFIFCGILTLYFKFVRSVNVFDKFANKPFLFLVNGSLVILTFYFIKTLIQSCLDKSN